MWKMGKFSKHFRSKPTFHWRGFYKKRIVDRDKHLYKYVYTYKLLCQTNMRKILQTHWMDWSCVEQVRKSSWALAMALFFFISCPSSSVFSCDKCVKMKFIYGVSVAELNLEAKLKKWHSFLVHGSSSTFRISNQVHPFPLPLELCLESEEPWT